ncbi:MAG: hypothetical protein GWO07_16505 [Candidatus Dadabacteria bacterium]|nr:hypothetical protein [Candidatus Dadabacteria bacterium]NIS10301.1 hypothetical protein [Candidatus Dadabacteria bacterium]NIV42909.1 hypothetical protein [Candidatus Dadabacteria bacterium]NIY23219.1 hypothetical protein [Candidatus Dadabacteria bacterium]
MLKTNIIGAFIICAILFTVVGYFFAKLNINFYLYGKTLLIIAVLGVIISLASLGKSNN